MTQFLRFIIFILAIAFVAAFAFKWIMIFLAKLFLKEEKVFKKTLKKSKLNKEYSKLLK